MADEIHAYAYAKVNFGLKVLPKRDDGFHNLESVFQTISLADELFVRKQDKFICSVESVPFGLPLENTLSATYNAFCSVTGNRNFGVNVRLVKNIPAGGGLGGGSSDAAVFLRILEELSGVTLSDSERFQISGMVGSDVFFFSSLDKSNTGCALVSGRGEIVRKISGRNDLVLLLVFPKEKVPTGYAYNLVDKMIDEGKFKEIPSLDELESIYNSPVEKWEFMNMFTPAVSKVFPEIALAIEQVRDTGALYAEMSGSGSTVFGVFPSVSQAEYAKSILSEKWECRVVRAVCDSAV